MMSMTTVTVRRTDRCLTGFASFLRAGSAFQTQVRTAAKRRMSDEGEQSEQSDQGHVNHGKLWTALRLLC